GDYTQEDPLVQQILERDWNYIHPDFRGMNNTPKSCGSKYVIDDIDQAISFALNNCNVDMQNIHVIGVSGGGMATLLSYMNSNYPVLSFSAWVPISDLAAWYYQSLGRKNKYAGHILTATGSIDSVLNVEEARNRSPLFMATPTDKRKGSRLTIYAGIHDGYEGSVPVSQSLNFYNKVIKDNGASDDQLISENEILKLVSMRMYPTLTDKKIGDRNVIYERNFKNISLILFEGRHEMLTDVALELLQID
ncbi:MAG: peptidase, partial [Cyclobacteriaceae bacterium]|nr:peptidase [Cyclobacteriaceae bacterium]